MTTLRTLWVLPVVLLSASAAGADTWKGSVTLGGIIKNQTGDRSAVQEIYNVHDGFSLDRLTLTGTPAGSDYLRLDLREVNLDARQGSFVYRRPGIFKLDAGFDQHRQIFSGDGDVNSMRKDWKVGAEYQPSRYLDFSGRFNYLTRDGDRLSYPAGTESALGTTYDNTLKSGQLSARVQKNGRGAAVTYNVSDFSDGNNGAADRTGQVISARLFSNCLFYDKLTHLVRGSYGVSKLTDGDLKQKFSRFQYTGVLAPLTEVQLRYNFDANRVDDDATDLRTDRFRNGVDATYFYRYGQVSGGYEYETNDDDHALTRYHSWQAGTVFRYEQYVTARVNYAGRFKKDQEELTLLKDIESDRIRAKLQVKPCSAVTVGGGYARREREFTDIDVESDGETGNGFFRCAYEGWGAFSADYSFMNDTWRDRVDGFDTRSDIATVRVDFDRIPDLRLASGVTYLNIGRDLDIEKSMVFVEGGYTFQDNYRLELKYNVYNYDDYILLDRYYTANVLRINIGYDFDLK